MLLIQPEQVGDVVQPVAGHYKKYGVDFEVTMPKAAGLYRLTVTLHDPDGVAYDAQTQAMLSPMLVRVVGPFDAKVLATDAATLDAGTNVDLAVRVANLGTATWGEAAVVDHGRRGGGSLATNGRVVGHWVALDGGTDNLAPVDAALPSALEPGRTVDADPRPCGAGDARSVPAHPRRRHAGQGLTGINRRSADDGPRHRPPRSVTTRRCAPPQPALAASRTRAIRNEQGPCRCTGPCAGLVG